MIISEKLKEYLRESAKMYNSEIAICDMSGVVFVTSDNLVSVLDCLNVEVLLKEMEQKNEFVRGYDNVDNVLVVDSTGVKGC